MLIIAFRGLADAGCGRNTGLAESVPYRSDAGRQFPVIHFLSASAQIIDPNHSGCEVS